MKQTFFLTAKLKVCTCCLQTKSGALTMAKPTGHLLKKLRTLMKNRQYVSEAINAYIIPSGDSHQVMLHIFRQGWRQKFSDRGARASDRGAKMTEKLCFRALFCQISSDENPNFLRRGARYLRQGGCSPPGPPLAPPLFLGFL